MITEQEIVEEGNRIRNEFGQFTKQITIKETFYHGTYGRWYATFKLVHNN